MSDQEQSGQLLTMDTRELARELRLSPLTVARTERTRPGDLPPAVIVGRGKRLYPRQGVEQWFLQRAGVASPVPREHANAKTRRPGRPRKVMNEGSAQ